MAAPIASYVPTGGTITAFPTRAVEITASDTTEYEGGVAVYVGGAGNVTVVPLNGADPITFTAVPAGGLVPVTALKVMATGTTASDLVGVYA